MPLLLMTCPRNVTCLLLNSHLSALRITPAFWIRSSAVLSLSSCSFWSCPKIRTSSMRQRTPLSPSSMALILFWKCSGALEIPNGSLLKQYFPNGVMKVVRCQEVSANGICQKLLLASSLLKTAAPESWARVLSTWGKGCVSRSTLSLRGFRSTQMRTLPFFLGTTTIPAHQSVGTSTLEMTSRVSMRLSSSRTFSRRGMGTFLAVKRAWGAALGFRRISYSPFMVPSPLNNCGNFLLMAAASSCSDSTLANSWRAMMAGNPNRLLFNSRTTKASCLPVCCL